jgi:hypothetical protein
MKLCIYIAIIKIDLVNIFLCMSYHAILFISGVVKHIWCLKKLYLKLFALSGSYLLQY